MKNHTNEKHSHTQCLAPSKDAWKRQLPYLLAYKMRCYLQSSKHPTTVPTSSSEKKKRLFEESIGQAMVVLRASKYGRVKHDVIDRE